MQHVGREAEAEGDEPLVTSALPEDTASAAELERRGYEAVVGEPWMAYLIRSLAEPVPEPSVPDGFRLRTMRGDEDVEARVDCVVEAPDGSFASYSLVWLDEAIGVGLLEPVGTHPDYERRGLGSAVCRFGLRRLQELGAATAIVAPRGDDAFPVPKKLYESIGFRQHTRSQEYRKQR